MLRHMRAPTLHITVSHRLNAQLRCSATQDSPLTSQSNSYDAAHRWQHQSALVVGHTAIKELHGICRFKRVLHLNGWDTAMPGGHPQPMHQIVSPSVLQKLAGVENAAGVKAVAEVQLPPEANFLQTAPAQRLDLLLVLERVQDPGNLGTLLRTAVALGWHGGYLVDCCSPFNDKALKAGRTAAFKLPLDTSGSMDGLAEILQRHSLTCYGAVPSPSMAPGDQRPAGRAPNLHSRHVKRALILGSEGQGLSPAAQAICRPLTIPMPGDMESMNVAVAGGVLMATLSGALDPVLQQLEGAG